MAMLECAQEETSRRGIAVGLVIVGVLFCASVAERGFAADGMEEPKSIRKTCGSCPRATPLPGGPTRRSCAKMAIRCWCSVCPWAATCSRSAVPVRRVITRSAARMSPRVVDRLMAGWCRNVKRSSWGRVCPIRAWEESAAPLIAEARLLRDRAHPRRRQNSDQHPSLNSRATFPLG